MTADETATAARIALGALHELAKTGDTAAIMHLKSIGIVNALNLNWLAVWPPEAAKAVAESAAQSDEWIVIVPAIQELRASAIERQLPSSLGTARTIRPSPPKQGSGSTRDFNKSSQQGFARLIWEDLNGAYALDHFGTPADSYSGRLIDMHLSDVYLDGWRPDDLPAWRCEAQKRMRLVVEDAKQLPPLSGATLPQWIDLGMKWADAICLGRWDNFPWPPKIIARAKTFPSKFSKSPRGCKSVVKDWISKGFASLPI